MIKDALETLGTIIHPGESRDAIHLAVLPIEAAQLLRPGQHVGIHEGKASALSTNVGIVDPFLNEAVKAGQHFWLMVYPRQITSLRHVWTHPSIADSELPQSDNKIESEQWLRDFAASADCPDYHTLVAAAINNYDSWNSDYLHFYGSDAHGEIPPEFWEHVEIVTGEEIESNRRATYFSCSC